MTGRVPRDYGARKPRMRSLLGHWQEEGRCQSASEVERGEFTATYPDLTTARDLARRYCHGCPVITECFQWAYEETHFSGVAGGAMFSGTKERASVGGRRIRRIAREPEEDPE